MTRDALGVDLPTELGHAGVDRRPRARADHCRDARQPSWRYWISRGRMRFRHPPVRSAVYRSASPVHRLGCIGRWPRSGIRRPMLIAEPGTALQLLGRLAARRLIAARARGAHRCGQRAQVVGAVVALAIDEEAGRAGHRARVGAGHVVRYAAGVLAAGELERPARQFLPSRLAGPDALAGRNAARVARSRPLLMLDGSEAILWTAACSIHIHPPMARGIDRVWRVGSGAAGSAAPAIASDLR